MSHKRLASAFIKAGAVVKNIPHPTTGETSRNWIASNPKNSVSIEWRTQDDVTTYCIERSPMTDAYTDCFCDSYYHTIKSAVAALVGG